MGVDGQSHSRFTATLDEPLLRDKARAAIESGRLPTAKPHRMVYGRSGGESCAVCGLRIVPGQVLVELEFRTAPSPEGRSLRRMLGRLRATPKVQRYHLHHRCFAAWE